VTEVLNMEICKAKIFKSGIAVDVLQREFSHTALHGFKPLDILNSAGEIKAVHSAVDNNNNKAPAPGIFTKTNRKKVKALLSVGAATTTIPSVRYLK